MKNNLALWISVLIASTQFSCVTPGEKRQMKEDIARLQSQLVFLQKDVTSTGTTIASDSSRKTASINSSIDRLGVDIQRMKGEIDTLRVGVVTGRLPGSSAENEDSIAGLLSQLSERVTALEEGQEAILAAINKAGRKTKKPKKGASNERSKLKSLRGLQDSFGRKQYLYIVEDAKPIIKNNKGDAKKKAQYLYAESLYKLGKLRPAALAFNDFLEMKPSQNLAHAKLRLGDCFRHLGDKATAKLYYDELLTKHGGSEEAKIAQERLQKL